MKSIEQIVKKSFLANWKEILWANCKEILWANCLQRTQLVLYPGELGGNLIEEKSNKIGKNRRNCYAMFSLTMNQIWMGKSLVGVLLLQATLFWGILQKWIMCILTNPSKIKLFWGKCCIVYWIHSHNSINIAKFNISELCVFWWIYQRSNSSEESVE